MSCRALALLLSLLVATFDAEQGSAERGRPGRPRTSSSFHVDGLLPKAEIGATRLRKEHPRADGRGVVVAIFDTGVDPGAPGLQVTTTGLPKLLDLVDASGSGDVETSHVVKADAGLLEGLSGKQLRLGRGGRWRCPSGEYHLGLKAAWELFPRQLLPRLKEERAERFERDQDAAEAALLEQLADWRAEHPNPTPQQGADLAELELRLELLREAGKREDLGPALDCVVFHDGKVWRAVIDTDEDGELGDESVMTDYRTEREHATFGDEDLLNFAVNIYEDGDLLSIVTDTGAHGTHVAGIVAGHFPESPELDGIAPGAQLIGVKIGDTRVGSSSLGTGPARGLAAVLRNDCRVINMSYGGSSPTTNTGRMAELYSEIVNDHGVIFVASAGNSGPALSTVGSPGGTTSAILGVGATITPSMMRDEYSLRELLPETQYTWSARGPTADGDMGVDISAPGGAIAPVPNWVLQHNMRMNGTSMSAPSVAGGVTLLVSLLEQEGVAWSPASVRRAIKATARPVAGMDPWSQGAGLLQVQAAGRHLIRHRDRDDTHARYELSIRRGGSGRGLYVRSARDADRVHDIDVNVRVKFPEDWDNREKVDFQKRVSLRSEASWVKAPSQILLTHGRRDFGLRVDPRNLPEGAHHAEVVGVDADAPSAGALFRFPVTVIRSKDSQANSEYAIEAQLDLEPGSVMRHFVTVPDGATWADLRLRLSRADERRLFVLHAVQVQRGKSVGSTSKRWYVSLEPGEDAVRSLAVNGDQTLEVTVAQYWSSLGSSRVNLETEFHGLVPTPSSAFIGPGESAALIDVRAPIGREAMAPTAKLATLRRPLRPTKASLRPREGARDLLPKGRREHELILEYEFKLKKDSKVQALIAPLRHPGVGGDIESKLFMIHDSAQRRVGVGVGDRQVSLAKGKYTLRVHLRHDDTTVLRRLEDAVLWLDMKLPKPVTLTVRQSANGVFADKGSFADRDLRMGERVSVWLDGPNDEERPKNALAGDLVVGEFRLGTDPPSESGAGSRPGRWPLTVALPAESSSDEKESSTKDEDKDEEPTLSELRLKSRLELLGELRKDKRYEDFASLAAELAAEDDDNLRLQLERVRKAESSHEGEGTNTALLEAVDELKAMLDLTRLAAWRGLEREVDAENPEVAEEREEREEREAELAALREALLARAKALEATGGEDFDEALLELKAWEHDDEDAMRELEIERERNRQRFARALELLTEAMDGAEPDREQHEERIELLRALGWEHLASEEERWLSLRFPKAYPPF